MASSRTSSKSDSEDEDFDLIEDYAEYITTMQFKDTTSILKSIFNESSCYVRGPCQPNTNSNFDMIKRFLEIQVGIETDQQQKIIDDISLTSNYKLFTSDKLNLHIAQNTEKKFFEEHMGKHPVIFLKMRRFGDLVDYPMMLTELQSKLKFIYLDHHYLIDNDKIWENNEERQDFLKYCNYVELSEREMFNSIPFLSKLLFKYFHKEPVIMLKNFDDYVDDLRFKAKPDADKCINFIHFFVRHMLVLNDYYDRVILLGSIRLHYEANYRCPTVQFFSTICRRSFQNRTANVYKFECVKYLNI